MDFIEDEYASDGNFVLVNFRAVLFKPCLKDHLCRRLNSFRLNHSSHCLFACVLVCLFVSLPNGNNCEGTEDSQQHRLLRSPENNCEVPEQRHPSRIPRSTGQCEENETKTLALLKMSVCGRDASPQSASYCSTAY